MSHEFIRIDDRLIHGQVVLGWVNHLHTRQLILCDNSVASSEWEKELYLSIVPDELKAKVLNVEDTAAYIREHPDEIKYTIILLNGPAVVEELLDKKVNLQDVNVGGIHYQEGKKKYLTYLYLDPNDIASFSRCFHKGVHFDCQDVPEGKKIPLENIIPLK
jgi:mannose/fructose/N-acetylgalactosamine-specific phosphotransferase system component IIB